MSLAQLHANRVSLVIFHEEEWTGASESVIAFRCQWNDFEWCKAGVLQTHYSRLKCPIRRVFKNLRGFLSALGFGYLA